MAAHIAPHSAPITLSAVMIFSAVLIFLLFPTLPFSLSVAHQVEVERMEHFMVSLGAMWNLGQHVGITQLLRIPVLLLFVEPM